MTCTPDDFKVTGDQRRIADDVVTVPAITKHLAIEGVLYFVSGVFCGFVGDDEAALESAERVRKMRAHPPECSRCGNIYDHRYPCVG